jgi:1,4-dihydroxy-2-naphthoate octaprenyltransferase
MPKGVVWTAVISALAGAGTLISAYQSSTDWVLALGFVSVASALLASREK